MGGALLSGRRVEAGRPPAFFDETPHHVHGSRDHFGRIFEQLGLLGPVRAGHDELVVLTVHVAANLAAKALTVALEGPDHGVEF